jgi:hypothetical protein
MKASNGLDSDLPQLPETGNSAVSARVAEVNELVRHLWNAVHGLNNPDSRSDAEVSAASKMVRELKRQIMDGVERLPADYARVYNSAIIAVYSLLR